MGDMSVSCTSIKPYTASTLSITYLDTANSKVVQGQKATLNTRVQGVYRPSTSAVVVSNLLVKFPSKNFLLKLYLYNVPI